MDNSINLYEHYTKQFEIFQQQKIDFSKFISDENQLKNILALRKDYCQLSPEINELLIKYSDEDLQRYLDYIKNYIDMLKLRLEEIEAEYENMKIELNKPNIHYGFDIFTYKDNIYNKVKEGCTLLLKAYKRRKKQIKKNKILSLNKNQKFHFKLQ